MMLAQVLWQSPSLLPAAIATLGVMLAAVLWLYPPQVRELPRPWRWLPPMLRAAAIAALVVSLLQPAVLRPRTAAQQGAVVVLVDRSRSMSVTDVARTPAELVALAAGLAALPDGRRTEAAPQLRAQLQASSSLVDDLERARNEAEYARISGRGVIAAQARLREVAESLLATLRSLPAPAATQPPASAELVSSVAALNQSPPALDPATLNSIRSRLTAAMRALTAFQAEVDTKLYERDVQVRDACTRIGQLSRIALAQRALGESPAGVLGELRATAPLIGFTFADDTQLAPSMLTAMGREGFDISAGGGGSDVTGAVGAGMRRMHGRAVQGLVIFSDGRQVTRSPAESSDLSALGVPVYTVFTAAPLRRDVSITAVDLPDSARIGEAIRVRVEVQGVGVRGETAEVRVDIGDVRQIRRITFGEESLTSSEFEVTPQRGGAAEVVVSVQPLAKEVSEENNRVQRTLKVAWEPLRVTLIAGADAGKQYASLHEALSRAPWVRLREVDEDELERLPPALILSQDVVLLCDIPSSMVTSRQWDALDKLVRQRGGSAVLMAGAHLPIAYAQDAVAADWLPQEPQTPMQWRIWPGGEPHFRLASSRAPETSDLAGAWQNVAMVSRVAPVTKPRPGVRTLLAERDGGAAVVTESTRGVGHVFYLGTDESWRWRGAGEATSHQFWPALLRRAAPEPYAAVEGNLALDAEHLDLEPNESVNVRARVFAANGLPSDAPTQTVNVFRGGQRVAAVTLTAAGEGTGRYEGLMDGLSAGEYLLRLDPPEDASMEVPADPVTLALRVAQHLEEEMTDVSGDPELLRGMAESSGGKALTLDQVSLLPHLLADNRAKQNRLVEYTLWDSPYLFAFVLACLSGEWSLRKKFGLA